MGEYLPPPLGILCLAAYLEANHESVEIEVIDCQAEQLDWAALKRRIEVFHPDIVAPSSLATSNVYLVIRTVELAKKVDSSITTLAGGQHFTALAQEILQTYPDLDIIVRGEGEQTLLELVLALERNTPLSKVTGVSFRQNGKIVHTPRRALIKNLDSLPYPGYHFVREHMKRYHFKMMAGDAPYALIEGSRGCDHNCSFCTQWRFWGRCRKKSPKRIADEFEYCYHEFGSRFLWFADDNYGLGPDMEKLCDDLIARGIVDDLLWFIQVRTDDILANRDLLPKMRRAGVNWVMAGAESHNPATLDRFQKRIDPSKTKEAMDLLKTHRILAQVTAIIGERADSHESIAAFRKWIRHVDPDIAIFMVLTPFPGTEYYETAKQNNWIEETNWANFDMIHAIMPTEHLTRSEVQEELYECYRAYYGSWRRRIFGLFSRNKVKRTYFWYMMRQGLLMLLRGLVR
jgi:anaerobic magnesium-protoporphyrin IX monomethyl ester cyclase